MPGKGAPGEIHAYGLHYLARAIRDNPTLPAEVVLALMEAILNGHGWRIDRPIRSTVEIVKSSPEVVDKLFGHQLGVDSGSLNQGAS